MTLGGRVQRLHCRVPLHEVAVRRVVHGGDEAEGQRDERELAAQRPPPSPPLRNMATSGLMLRPAVAP